jgi:dCMP deaminase
VETSVLHSKAVVFMSMARTLSLLGTCDRRQVGALIVRDGRCISWGYNGAPPGLPHCGENNHGWGDDPLEGVGLGCRNATHAEANAIAFAARQGISTEGGNLFVTVSPCDICSRLIIAAGIVAVWYWEEYRDPRGLELLREANLPTHQCP